MAAPISTRFFTMYCPSKVRLKGKSIKQISGLSTNGRKVPGICRARRKRPTLIKGVARIQMPIAISQIPRMGMKISGSNQ
jgi:hypothetical protein